MMVYFFLYLEEGIIVSNMNFNKIKVNLRQTSGFSD